MTVNTSHLEEVRAYRSTRQRVADMLRRYPRVSDRERQEILGFIRHGRHLDIGLLTSDDTLRPRLDAFVEDHKHHLQLGVADIARLVVVLAAAVLVCVLIWDLALPPSI